MIWFTSDLHIAHANIIKYCNRPFNSLDEMNNTILDNYLKTVAEDDIVFILGDLTIKRGSSSKKYISMIYNFLPGQKHLIKGNHDYFSKEFYKNRCGFLSVRKKISTSKYVLVHDPAHFSKMDLQSDKLLIHGHRHYLKPTDNFENSAKIYDCGVDANHFFPVTLGRIKEYFIE